MNVQVLGAGSFGMVLARLLAGNGHAVRLWCHSGVASFRHARERPEYLPGVILPPEVEISDEVDPDADFAVLAVPSHVLREVVKQHPFSPKTVRINVAKGIENGTLLRMSEIINEVTPNAPMVSLSGPSHAEEVAAGLPTTVVVAGKDDTVCVHVQELFLCESFRVYTSPDLTGVELGGALKNVIAIAAGVCDGFALGDNAKAALMTRGLAEMARLGMAMGADPLTFAGLSGMGDLIATCNSRHSRNRRLGEGIARGQKLEEVLSSTTMVAEGVRTTRSAHALSVQHGVEMPIAEAAYRVLFEGIDARSAIAGLMLREAKPEPE